MQTSERSKALIALIILVVTLVNQALQIAGFSPIPFAEDKAEMVLSLIATAIASVYAWWKNQNVTKEAAEAQKFLQTLKKSKRYKK